MHLETKYEGKLQKEIEKLVKEIEKLKKERSERRKLLNAKNKTIKRLASSRDEWKSKLKVKQKEIKNLKAQLHRYGKAKRHKYDICVMELCVRLRTQANCSYASICKILIILQMHTDMGLTKIPCANSIQNWVSKLGLFSIKLPDNEPDKENMSGYCCDKEVTLIIDESIRLGQEKQLVLLSVPFEKAGTKPLRFQDVKVEYVEGSNSWDGLKIKNRIDKLAKARGFKVKNILSDEDGKLKRAARLYQVTHLPEISHAIGTCLKKTYKELDDYKAFTKLIGSYKSRIVNQSINQLFSSARTKRQGSFYESIKIDKMGKDIID